MTPRQAVEAVLKGGLAERIPFTIYENKLPQCLAERRLRNHGMCIVQRHIPIYKTKTPNVNVKTYGYTKNNRRLVRTEYETPNGTLYEISEPAGFTTWTHKRLFTTPEDYKPIFFLTALSKKIDIGLAL